MPRKAYTKILFNYLSRTYTRYECCIFAGECIKELCIYKNDQFFKENRQSKLRRLLKTNQKNKKLCF